ADDPPYFKPSEDSVEYQYMMERRKALDGSVPKRTTTARRPLSLPDPKTYAEMWGGSAGQEVSTTMAFTRLLRSLTRDKQIGERIVPIIPDEARTFGMDSLFREIGIYASQGQKYEPVDHDLLLSYMESSKGQILEEGITEAGAMSSFIAAGTSYSTRGVPMMPFYTFYSMFGFQRVGDLIWQAADMRARGFLMAATAGRTTLMGEGLQHQDGHSLVLASTVPAVQAYDPAFAYEVGAIVQAGIERMYGDGSPVETDVFYYITLYNENYEMPVLPDTEGLAEQINEGIYKFADAPDGTDSSKASTILFSGVAHVAAREAVAELAEHYGVGAELWSVTSYKALREDGLAAERHNRLHPSGDPRTPIIAQRLAESNGPITAVSDFMAIVPDQIRQFVDHRTFTTLGTDGMGRSDTREALRRFFEIDTGHVVVGVLSGLLAEGKVEASVVEDAIRRYDIDPDAIDPWKSFID
ncbi:MAG: pyruvate dehydrogenase (acetyl-transferring), homodimeric type, partial [Ilumatobacter sp.]